MCKCLIEDMRQNTKGTIVNLTLNNVSLARHEIKSIENGELLDALQEEEIEEESFVWVSNLAVNEKRIWSKEKLAYESDFFSELFKTAEQVADISESTLPLYGHPLAGKYLGEIHEDEKRRLAGEAEALLVDLLYKEHA
jgi:hypothetical protein